MDDELLSLRPTVVVVDDSSDVRSLMRLMLQTSGFDVVGEGGDGDEAILLAHRLEPDLMLLDMSMPGTDGIEALPAVRALSPSTRVVIFTGFEEPALAERMRELGAADFIEKSVPLGALKERLHAVLGAPVPTAATILEREERPRDIAPTIPLRPDFDLAGQEVLNEHIAQFRELFDRAEIGMATLTTSGTVVRANRALAELMSCEPADLVGVDYGRLASGHGDELDRNLDDISRGGLDLAAFEHDLPPDGRAKRGRTTVVRVTLAPIRDARREVLYVFAQVQDVTAQRLVEGELRRSEESFRRLVSAVEEYAIFTLDVDGVVVSWNAGAERIKGYRSHEIIGRHFRVFYPDDDQAGGHPEHNLAMALRNGSYAEEGWRVRSDGTRFWASVVITAVRDDDGQHIGFAKVTRDQTGQRAHEQERQRFVEERIHLLAVTAHELRTPTAVIDGSAIALQGSWGSLSDEQRQEALASIRTSAERLRRLTVDLAEASRADGETLSLVLADVSLAHLVAEAAARARTAHPGVNIEVDCPDDLIFPGDPERLAQAVDNLVDNAIRHSSGPVRIEGRGGETVIVRVSDTGPGVDAGGTAELFERFASTGTTAGSGLGLFLVREIARRHGGQVRYLPPTPSSPTTFEIALPLQS